MAIAYGSTILDGTYTKIVRFNMLDTDAASALAFTYVALGGMTDFAVAPIDYHVVTISSAANIPVTMGITAVGTAGFTLRCYAVGAGGAGGAVVVDVVMRRIHSVDR